MATPVFTLTLFGSFAAAVDGAPLTGFRTDKVRALLAYLAIEADRPHLRASLATLLWPDMSDEIALRNLRKTLHRLHEALAPSLGAADTPFVTTRQTIQLHPEAWTVDVGTFQHLLDISASHSHRALHVCPACLERLTQAAALYRGELLAGLGLPDAEPFEEWLLLKREMLLHQALQVLFDLAAAHLEREEYEQAYAFAVRQVELDPGREEAHRQVIRALALNGQRSEALAYFERCRQLLLDTFGVEPAVETVALADQLHQDEMSGDGTPAFGRPLQTGPPRLHNLPAQLTPFLGRTTELLQITEYLRDPECRLVSILGPGGVGKTRLAIRAAEPLARHGRFADGIVFVPLAETGSAELLPTALVTGLGLDLDEDSDSRTQLLQYLAPRACLLVLDNLEHLLAGVDLLVDILTAAPGVRFLVTSRLPLELQAEQRLLLEGLDYPSPESEPSPAVGGTPSEPGGAAIAGSSSVQLFIQAAGRIQPGFALSAANQQDVLRICWLVNGMPLALELAAPWVRVMDCAAIASAIEQNLALLTTTARDVPARHRSMEAVWTQSWCMLGPGEQASLAQLSVFRGPFDLDAAMRVAGVTVLELAAFVDTCLLQRTTGGLYQLHQLLRQFAAQMLVGVPSVDADAAQERQSTYYLGLVAAQEQALYGPNARPSVDSLRQQLGNIRQAWDWAAEHNREDTLSRSLEAMVRFWELAGLFDEADSMLAHGVTRLQSERTPTASMSALLVQLLIWQSHFHEIRTRVDDAIRTAEAGLALAQRCGDHEGEAEARSLLGEVLPHQSEFIQATMHLGQACSYFETHQRPRQLARALRRLGIAHWRAGEYTDAVSTLDPARAMQQSLGDHWELARVCSALAGVAFEQGNPEKALMQVQEALRLYEASDDRRNVATMKGNLALVYRRLGRFDLALQQNQHDLEASRELGDRHDLATSLGNRGAIYLEMGNVDQALRCFEEALEIEEALGNAWDAARHRANVAHAHHSRGDRGVALAHFGRALPVLRAHGARYYVVSPLLDAAELQLDLRHFEEAAELTQEAATLIHELGLEDKVERSQVIAEKIAAAQAERNHASAV